jgi:hypothetical protein
MKSSRRDEQPRLLGFEPGAGGAGQGTPRPAGAKRSDAAGAKKPAARADAGPNSDLVGRSFQDREERVVVTEVSRANPAHVVVRRERDGHSWTIPAGVVRLILPPARGRRAA